MKTYKLITLLLLLISLQGFSQTYTNADNEMRSAGFTETSSENNFLNNQGQTVEQNNSVFITQLGNGNEAVVRSRSDRSTFRLLQNGSDNEILLNSRAAVIDETVVQLGNDNTFVDFARATNVHNLEVVQRGNNQNLTYHGGNSISDRLKITMDGQVGQTVIVRNFN